MKESCVIRVLDPNQLAILSQELFESQLSWAPHYKLIQPAAAPLRHGSSIYIQSLHTMTGHKIEDNQSLFSKTVQMIAELTQNQVSRLARSYWHLLRPGERIDVHRDIDSEPNGYFSRINRYQVFSKLDPNFIVVMDSKLWNMEPSRELSNSLIYFNHQDWHYYANNSDVDISFLVMDFLK